MYFVVMLMIRLQRVGKTKQPSYRFIVSDKRKDTQAGSLEILGFYNPLANPKVLKIDAERVKYWMSVGAQPSDTVHNMLIAQGIITGKKRGMVNISNKRKGKIDAEAKKAAPAAA
jgi:small subunit ribosomal protein S16